MLSRDPSTSNARTGTSAASTAPSALFIPTHITRLTLLAPVRDACTARVEGLRASAQALTCDIVLAAPGGEVLARLERVICKPVAMSHETPIDELTLDLQSVKVGARRYTVNTADVQQKGEGSIGANKRTAEMVGGGAALGTLIGAIAGGGKGAAIGAGVGAGVGAGFG